MIARRDILIGAACVGAAGASYALKPRNEALLLPKGEELQNLVPMTFPGWTGQDVGDPLALNKEGTLSARLYNQLVTRYYTETATGSGVMMLLAYGAKQNDDLQLHRPEVCYPAFGFILTDNKPAQVTVGGQVNVPARRLVAKNDEGTEYVTYWSRLGEYFPQNGGEQRQARFLNAVHGLVPDGVLCRFSSGGADTAEAWRRTDALVQALIKATPRNRRRVLIGSQRAAALAA